MYTHTYPPTVKVYLKADIYLFFPSGEEMEHLSGFNFGVCVPIERDLPLLFTSPPPPNITEESHVAGPDQCFLKEENPNLLHQTG